MAAEIMVIYDGGDKDKYAVFVADYGIVDLFDSYKEALDFINTGRAAEVVGGNPL